MARGLDKEEKNFPVPPKRNPFRQEITSPAKPDLGEDDPRKEKREPGLPPSLNELTKQGSFDSVVKYLSSQGITEERARSIETFYFLNDSESFYGKTEKLNPEDRHAWEQFVLGQMSPSLGALQDQLEYLFPDGVIVDPDDYLSFDEVGMKEAEIGRLIHGLTVFFGLSELMRTSSPEKSRWQELLSEKPGIDHFALIGGKFLELKKLKDDPLLRGIDPKTRENIEKYIEMAQEKFLEELSFFTRGL